MHEFREYIFSVCGAAIVCSVINPLIKRESVGKLVLGLSLVLSILGPLANGTFSDVDLTADRIQYDAQQAVLTGEENSKNAISEIIKSKTVAYILQKADVLGLQLEVDVTVSNEKIPTPQSVSIIGSAAPYAKQQLQEMIERDLAIPKENQVWISASG